ncbi:MAG: 4-vinyl reductase [Deltaproteobacteria bacterium]|jgi:predicted hydrocarbon binding protein|nr:4-vinyl reductase [Deltaproteobacteria bacterium]
MKNIFSQYDNPTKFTWEKLGDIKEGRGDLGEDMPVLVYRLMQYTMLDVLSESLGEEQANEYFRKAGFLAGTAFAQNTLDCKAEFKDFAADLQKKLKELKIGILRIEEFNKDTGDIELTVGQDLDCSGLPDIGDTVCCYDEGFIAGILQVYSDKKYIVREIDCWANGDRVCRFRGTPEPD